MTDPPSPAPDLLARLLGAGRPVSRNRDFALFESAEGRRVLRLLRLVESLEADLQRPGSHGTAHATPDGWQVTVRNIAPAADRHTTLPRTLVPILRTRGGPLAALLAQAANSGEHR